MLTVTVLVALRPIIVRRDGGVGRRQRHVRRRECRVAVMRGVGAVDGHIRGG